MWCGEDSAPWEAVLRKLAEGNDPDLPLGDLIRLDELVCVEMGSPNATEIQIVHAPAGRMRRRGVDFCTTGERDELIAALEGHFGKPLSWTDCPLSFARAIQTPLILAVVASLLFSAIAWLSAYWTAHPPPPPRGKTEQDALVRLLIWAGPDMVLLVGAVPMLAAVTWLVSRILRPPRVQVFQVRDSLER
jgi:hypothetical protein